ncbi:hypothetical protein DL93DRAFT_2080629 [Clavulina sp. PMI_390]|nr:hypothetical protein DL93DRAFT_2080629 [Clavulina sp. PMI_390]
MERWRDGEMERWRDGEMKREVGMHEVEKALYRKRRNTQDHQERNVNKYSRKHTK